MNECNIASDLLIIIIIIVVVVVILISHLQNTHSVITISVTGVLKISNGCLVGMLGYSHDISPAVITVQTTATIGQRN